MKQQLLPLKRFLQIDTLVKHAAYGKYVRRRVKYKAHDESNESRTGDTVTIAECRPLSRRKSWRLVSVLERAS